MAMRPTGDRTYCITNADLIVDEAGEGAAMD